MNHYFSKTALLAGIIDYAGTFPPAALPFLETLKLASGYRENAKHPWLLGKIVYAMADLKKISARLLYESGSDGSQWLLAALGSELGEKSQNRSDKLTSLEEQYLHQMEWDLRELRHCQERGANGSHRYQVVAYETKLPIRLVENKTESELFLFLRSLLDRYASLSIGSIEPFFELGVQAAEWRGSLKILARAMSEWSAEQVGTALIPGIKIRTGGNSRPAYEDIAFAITLCTSHGLRFKATQGLHHAVTSQAELGFVNLFAALAFSQVMGGEAFPELEVVRCLSEKNPAAFQFGELSFRWEKFEISLDKIEAARRQHGASFGSCSLNEPDDDLATVYPTLEKK